MEWQQSYADGYVAGERWWQLLWRQVRWIMLLALVLALLHLGMTNPTARRLTVQAQGVAATVWRAGDRIITAYFGPALLLRQRSQGALAELSEEIARLQWVEAEADVKAARLAVTVAAQVAEVEQARAAVQQQQVALGREHRTAATVLVSSAAALQRLDEAQALLTGYRDQHRGYIQVTALAHALQAEARQEQQSLQALFDLFTATLTAFPPETLAQHPAQQAALQRSLQQALERSGWIGTERRQLERELVKVGPLPTGASEAIAQK